MNNIIWLSNGLGSVANGEMCYDNSTRIDHKRGHQWSMDTSEQELFFNKKQAIESINETPGRAVMVGSLWCGGSSSQPERQRDDRPYGPKPVPSSVVFDMNMEKKGSQNQFGNDSSISLSMSGAAEGPLFLNNGLRKVNVNEVKISENCLPQLLGNNTFCPVENNNRVMSSTFKRTAVSLDPTFSKMDKNFISVGQASSKTDGNFMLTGQYYNGIDNNMLSIGQAINRGSYNINTENRNFISMGSTYSKVHDNFFAADPFYHKLNELFVPYSKGETSVAICGQQDVSDVIPYTEEDSSISSMVGDANKGEQTTTISFGGFQGNPEERDLISSYGALVNQSSVRPIGALGHKDSAEQQSGNASLASTSKADGVKKNKEGKTKKGSSSNFPSNVKSLLSTGIFDGVPVKYVSWSREKNLRGVIKGTGYLCSCQNCKLAKAANAYEFELHAGCKTKHPNNHIYFENGKTIYAVVQELKSTPQEVLFEVIQNVTGSSINLKNFNTWKSSYQAATREIQRIYGKDEMAVIS